MVEPVDTSSKEAIRRRVWTQLRSVARPDSRFHWNFAEFIADYEGSEVGAEQLQALPAWQSSRLMFITPDNNLEVVRRKAMEDGKRFVMSTYGIARGFLFIDPARLSPHDYGWAATLDGMDRFGQPLNLLDIRSLGSFDLLVTGGSAVSTNGVRFGKGHGYFDLEWALLSEIGRVDETSEVVDVVHDCQVLEETLQGEDHDVPVDWIVTPTRTLHVPDPGRRIGRVRWDMLAGGPLASIPPILD